MNKIEAEILAVNRRRRAAIREYETAKRKIDRRLLDECREYDEQLRVLRGKLIETTEADVSKADNTQLP